MIQTHEGNTMTTARQGTPFLKVYSASDSVLWNLTISSRGPISRSYNRWYVHIFKPKNIPTLENFDSSCNGKGCYMYSIAIWNLLHTAIWYSLCHFVILWLFGMFSPLLVYCVK
jgi:hypothetical protein